MKIKFEHPWPVWFNKDPDCFQDTTMFDVSFDTKLHYFKNHSTNYYQLVFLLFGFGVRISNDI